MSVTYGFFDSVNGDRKYNASTMSEFYTGICSQGVFQSVDNGLAVSAGTGFHVSVATGRAIIQEHWIKNDAALTLAIPAASSTYARIDAVVIRFSSSNRNITIAVKEGTAAASPAAPAMTRTGGTYEMALAYVNVAANATSVTVTDKRSDSSVCGWAAVAQAIDGTYEAMIDAMKTGFDGVTYPTPVAQVQGSDNLLNNEVVTSDNNSSYIYHKNGYTVGRYNTNTSNTVHQLDVPYAGTNGTSYRLNVTECTGSPTISKIYLMHQDGTYQSIPGNFTVGTDIEFTANADFVTVRIYARYETSQVGCSIGVVFSEIGKSLDETITNIKNDNASEMAYINDMYGDDGKFAVSFSEHDNVTTHVLNIPYNGVTGKTYSFKVVNVSPVTEDMILYLYLMHSDGTYQSAGSIIDGEEHQLVANADFTTIRYYTRYTSPVGDFRIDTVSGVVEDSAVNSAFKFDAEEQNIVLPETIYTTSEEFKSYLNTCMIGTKAGTVRLVYNDADGKRKIADFDDFDWSNIPNNGTATVVFCSENALQYSKDITVKKKTTNPSTSAIKYCNIGDSITNRGVAYYVANTMAAHDVTVTMIGTMNNQLNMKGEGREGWKYTNFTGANNKTANGTTITPLLVKNTGSLDTNPFLKVATAEEQTAYADHCYTYGEVKYIFDFRNYLTVQELDDPDIVTIALSTNDFGSQTYIEDCTDSMEWMVTRIREALPNAIIGIIPTTGFAIGADRMIKALKWTKACIDAVASLNDNKVYVVPVWVAMERSTSYPITETSLASDETNVNTAVYSDATHNSARQINGQSIAQWMCNVIS